jgi:hypothetical protein
MTDEGAVSVLRSIWAADGSEVPDVDAICGPAKNCKNMRDVTLDGFAEPGMDLATAWRTRLEREGKLGKQGTIRDLVLGDRSGDDAAPTD